MQNPPIIKHIRDILILPFTVTVIIPYFCYDKNQVLFPGNPILKVVGIILILAGLALFIRTVYLFGTIGKGTLAPWSPTQRLVVKGPYKYCRNPMITGVLSILLGESLFLNSINILIWVGIFFIVNTIYFILMEEPDLHERFGDDYVEYKKQVPRWIPKFKPYQGKE